VSKQLPSNPAPPPESAPACSAAAPNQRDLVAALAAGLAVIEAFDQERPRLTISEVAARCGLTRAAARRYLITLEHLGYVSSERKMHTLTAKVLRLGESYVHSARLPRAVEPAVQRLGQSLREASAAGVLDGDDVICIAATHAGRPVSSIVQRGTRVPAYCSANGRVLLGALPAPRLDAWLERQAQQPLAALTPNTVTDLGRLRAEIERGRAQGYCVVDGELEAGLRALSVPLLNFRGEVVAALNVTTQAARVSKAELVDTCLAPLLLVQSGLRSML
jgi:IclR family pca regulon transcriptional regulator